MDAGGICPSSQKGRKLIAELSLKAMNEMNYSAVNLGWNELLTGADFLKEMESAIKIPLITSNLIYKEGRTPFGKKYVIQKVGDVKIAILGIMPTEPSYKSPASKGCADVHEHEEKKEGTESKQTPEKRLLPELLEVVPPEEALKALVPEVRSQADMVILLSQCGYEATSSLVNKLEGIDLAISGQRTTWKEPDEKINVPIFEAAYRGDRLGYVRLTLDENGKIIQNKKKMISLESSVPFDTRILKITGNDINQKIRNQAFYKAQKEAEAMMKLSPQEYYEMLLKKEQEKNEGDKK